MVRGPRSSSAILGSGQPAGREEATDHPPPGGLSHASPPDRDTAAIWLLLFAVSFVYSSQNAFSIVGLPQFAESRGFTNAELGALLGIFPLATGLSALLSGPVSDLLGRRCILLVGLVLFGASLSAHVWATSYASLLALRGLAGAAGGMLAGLPAVLLSDLYRVERQRPLIARSASGYALGQTLGIPLGILLIEAHGYLALNALIGLACLALVPLSWRIVGRSSATIACDASIRSYLCQAKRTLKAPFTSTLSTVSYLSFAASSIFYIVLTLWLYDVAALQPSDLAPMYLASGLLQIFVLNILLRRMRGLRPKQLIGLSFLANLAVFAATGLLMDAVCIGFALFVLAAGIVAARVPSMQQLISNEGSSAQKGLRMSLVQTASHLGKATGAASASILYLNYGHATAMLVAAALLAPCAALFLKSSSDWRFFRPGVTRRLDPGRS